MQLSKAGEYAVRAMLHLAASSQDSNTKISDISKAWNIPESFLRKILHSLVKAGLVSSTRGINGGLALGHPAGKITLFDIVEAVEGKIYLNQCLVDHAFCENREWCPVHGVWRDAQEAFSQILKRDSLADLVKNPHFQSEFVNTNQ